MNMANSSSSSSAGINQGSANSASMSQLAAQGKDNSKTQNAAAQSKSSK